jgi:hypothetical protein
MLNPIPMRIRASRFLNERFRQRERPCYFADLFLWALIVIIATWPMVALVQAMEVLK